MKLVRRLLDATEKPFLKGGKLQRLYPVYEALDTFTFTPGKVTGGKTHVRDAMDQKRLMMTVVWALVPVILFAAYNTGYQANLAIERLQALHGGELAAFALDNWRTSIYVSLGLPFSSSHFIACVVHGLLYYLPILFVTFAAGGLWEVVFAVVRRHEINEGFLVTGMLFPLILPPAIPLWQVALGISFGVVIGKEVFGGVGMNFFNPALVSRAFLFFAYPADISGDEVWMAAQGFTPDGVSGATWLSVATMEGPGALAEEGPTFMEAFIGLVPGSIGETSALACLIGAAVLVLTRVGSYRTMLGVVAGTVGMTLLFNAIGSATNPAFHIPLWWHMVLGGWAFGTVFMATDPVSGAYTQRAQYIYGALIGVMAIAIRVVNPAFPEGMMLAILFANLFAPLIDWFFIRAVVKRRALRHG